MFWDVRVVTAPSADTDLSLIVTFDQVRYFINCGEGTQRTCTQRGFGFKKLDAILLTSGSSDVAGGLPGMLMSAADSGVPALHIAGPENALQYLVSCRTFVQREKFSVSWLPHPEDPAKPIHEASHLSIRAIPLSSTSQRPSFPKTQQDWEWRDLDLKLKNLTQDQLAGWRRTVLHDMFKKLGNLSGQASGTKSALSTDTSPANDSKGEANVTNPPLPSTSSTSDGHVPKPIRQYHPARMHIPQPIPHPSLPTLYPSPPTSPVLEAKPEDPDLRYAYILQAPPVRGKFDIKKAEALGVPKGPIRGRLAQGQSIEVNDEGAEGGKRIVKPEDVLGEVQDGGAFIMVDITQAHLPQLLAEVSFKEYQIEAGATRKQARLVVHRATQEVLRDERYLEWIKTFGPETHHLVANIDRFEDSITYTSSSWNLLKLNMLDEDIFQLPHTFNKGAVEDDPLEAPLTLVKPYQITRIFPPSPPTIPVSRPGDPPYPKEAEIEEAKKTIMQSMPEYATLVEEARKKVDQADVDMSGDDYGIVVTPLGTGSAIPSKYRNVSSTVVDIPDFGCVLLDAGEGTLGQLQRRYGSKLWSDVLSRLKMIFISHMHADHHIGLRRILEERLQHDPQENLYVVGPSFIALHLLENGMGLGESHGRTIFIDNYHLMSACDVKDKPRSPSPSKNPGRFEYGAEGVRSRHLRLAQDCLRELGLTRIQTPEVEHRGRAYGLALTHNSGWKIVYSGDTMPCNDLVEAGEDATLLVHEATLEDENAAMAIIKAHSTFGQAVDVGVRMKAKYVLLNHFSQRYPKLPRVQPLAAANDGETASRPKVALAFDLMTLPLRSFEKTSSYTDAMESLFAELAAEDPEDGEMEEKDDKKPAKGKSGKQPAEKQQVKKLRDMDESELTNRQKKKLERAGNWPKPAAEGGKKRPSDGEDVEMEKPAVKRTKSEIVAQGNQHD